jgi:hypothetical protein
LEEFPLKVQKELELFYFINTILIYSNIVLKRCKRIRRLFWSLFLKMGLKYCSDEMKSDKDIVIAGVRNNPYAHSFMNDKFLEDRDVAIETIKGKGSYLFDFFKNDFNATWEQVEELFQRNAK